MFCSLLFFLFLWVGEEKEVTKSRDKEPLQKQCDLICRLASSILILCHTKTSDFEQRCITRHQFPLFMSQECVHLKKSCFKSCDRVELVKPCAGAVWRAGCLELGEVSPLGFYCQIWLTFVVRVISLGWYFRNGVSCTACRNVRR